MFVAADDDDAVPEGVSDDDRVLLVDEDGVRVGAIGVAEAHCVGRRPEGLTLAVCVGLRVPFPTLADEDTQALSNCELMLEREADDETLRVLVILAV